MSFLDRNSRNQIVVSKEFKSTFNNTTDLDCKDSHIMDLLGEMNFDCGRTRWDSPILWTHMPSRKIVVAVHCPKHCSAWSKCPYTPQTTSNFFAFICEQEYEIRIRKHDSQLFETKIIVKANKNEHWFALPHYIRKVWEKRY